MLLGLFYTNRLPFFSLAKVIPRARTECTDCLIVAIFPETHIPRPMAAERPPPNLLVAVLPLSGPHPPAPPCSSGLHASSLSESYARHLVPRIYLLSLQPSSPSEAHTQCLVPRGPAPSALPLLREQAFRPWAMGQYLEGPTLSCPRVLTPQVWA